MWKCPKLPFSVCMWAFWNLKKKKSQLYTHLIRRSLGLCRLLIELLCTTKTIAAWIKSHHLQFSTRQNADVHEICSFYAVLQKKIYSSNLASSPKLHSCSATCWCWSQWQDKPLFNLESFQPLQKHRIITVAKVIWPIKSKNSNGLLSLVPFSL